MIIPVRCFTCGKEISTNYQAFKEAVSNLNNTEILRLDAYMVNNLKVEKSEHGKIMDKIGIKRYCCRRQILGTEDIIDII
tara:strand:+ start:8768 stop:9007 length:240 start_codon:yes stop_codon:yes gene_type:complete